MSPSRRVFSSLALSLLILFSNGSVSLCQQSPASVGQPTKQEAKPLTNADIIRMVKSGFAESVIINTIQGGDTQFDTSLDALFKLKESGVSQRIIEAMQSASTRKQPAGNVGQVAPGTTALSATGMQAQLTQPYVIYGEQQKIAIPPSSPTIVQTKAKGDSVPALMADSAVKDIAGDAIISAAARSVLSAPGIATLPIIGVAGMAVMSLPKVFGGEPTYTFVYALGGRHAPSVVPAESPRFEVVFSDVVGANPDDFIPVLVKVSPTDNNWRLVGAQRAKAKQFQSSDPSDLNYIEERIPIITTKLDRGRVVVAPEQPLAAGEYGLVLRPISNTRKVALKGIAARQGEGLLIGLVWDFSVAPPAQVAPTAGQAAAYAPQANNHANQTPATTKDDAQKQTAPTALPKEKEVPGSVSFQTTTPYDRAYEVALDAVKRAGYTIESASRETGQIKTELAIEHGGVDIGRAVVVTVMKESDTLTTIRVTAYKQGRRIGGQWQQRVGTKDKAQKLADSIQVALRRS